MDPWLQSAVQSDLLLKSSWSIRPILSSRHVYAIRIMFSHFYFMSLIRSPATTVCRRYTDVYCSLSHHQIREINSKLTQKRRRASPLTFNSSPSMVFARHQTGHSLYHGHATVSVTEALLLRNSTSYGQFRRHLKSHVFRFCFRNHSALWLWFRALTYLLV